VDRSQEHLGTPTGGVIVMRQLLLEATYAVERGEAPRGIDPSTYRSCARSIETFRANRRGRRRLRPKQRRATDAPLTAFAAAFATLFVASSVRADLPAQDRIVYSYSGGGATLGKTLDGAIDTWIALHGDTVAGRKVVFIRRDDTGIAPDVARRQAQELVVQEHVDILMGSALTPNAIAVAAVFDAGEGAVLHRQLGDVEHHREASRTHRASALPRRKPQFRSRSGRCVGHQDGVTSSFRINGPGIDAGLTFEKTFTAGGGVILGESRVPVANQEYAAYIQRAKDTKPQALYVFLNNGGGSVAFLHGCKSGADMVAPGLRFSRAGALVDEDYLPIIATPPTASSPH